MSQKTTLKYLRCFCTLTSIIALTWLFTACKSGPTPFIPPGTTQLSTDGVTISSSTAVPPTATPTPTNTPIPLALTVNGESITQTEYEASLARLLAAQPDLLPEDARSLVLEEFTDQLLLSQAATQAGFLVDKTLLENRITELVEQIGGVDALNTWMTANGYTEEFFQLELRRSISAAWMRDQISAGVPTSTEQVHVRQILLFTAVEANDIYAQLQGGIAFDIMAAYYDPVARGDLGWFPRGYLTEVAIEEVAFSLEPGAYSAVIETKLGFHIIQLVDRQAEQPLTPDVRMVLQEKALIQWLEQQRTVSDITVLIP